MNSCNAEFNGCATCGPILDIYHITVGSDNLGTLHEPFLQNCGCTKYINRTINATKSELCIGDGVGNCDQTQFSCSTTYNQEYKNIVDEYGRLILTDTITERGSANGFLIVEGNCPPENYVLNGIRNFKQVNGQILQYQTELFYTYPCGGENSSGPWYGSCATAADWDSESCNTLTYQENNDNPSCVCGGSNFSANVIYSLNGSMTLQQRYTSFAKTISDKLMILVPINSPHSDVLGNITTCGNGKRDDCWEIFANSISFMPDIDEPSCTAGNTQIKLKIATYAQDFLKKYSTIGGTVYVYAGGTGGKTPCCNQDFDGLIEKSYDFKINGDNNFNPNGLELTADDLGILNSKDYSEAVTFNVCVSVKSIKFL
jgi:hypothetical protein